jgi:hypothetical protein
MKFILQITQTVVIFFRKIFETLITFAKIIYENSYRIKVKKLNKKDSFIVLVNGPSLNKDIEKLKPYLTKNKLVVVNQFSLSTYFKELKPSYYVMLDGEYFFDKIEEKEFQQHLDTLTNEVDWEMTLFIPSRFKKSTFVTTVKQNPRITIQLFNITLANGGFKKINWRLYDNNFAMLQSQNVLVGVLFNLVKNEGKKVYIFGAQNDWHINAFVGKDNLVYLKQTHFYEEAEHIVQYRSIYKKEYVKFHELLESSAKALAGYHNVRHYANYKNCNIYNCSKDSFIDAFERLSDDEFISQITDSKK